ncbi:MAG: hypothetical protein RL456_1648 [Pseudomonadota bacterium]
MIDIRKTGSPGTAAALLRDIPASVIPYAAATALTRTAKAGQQAIVEAMPRVFQAPTRYTLNATRLVPATKKNLVATIAVKDQAGGNATRPESYLLPEVEGGARREKRFEKALRYQGLLARGQFAVPGEDAKLDASGNVSRATIAQILNALKGVRGGVGKKGQKEGKGKRLKNDLFVGVPTVGSGAGRRPRPGAPAGIYRREGDSGKGDDRRSRLRRLFIFTDQAPTYGRRLDFDGTVSKVVQDRFEVEFERAAAAILSRRRAA